MLQTLRIPPLTACVLAAAVLTGCGSSGGGAHKPLPPPGNIKVTSSAFAQGGTIPKRYTCDGAGLSPPLAWRRLPDATRSLVLVVLDPDAPGPTFFHWVIYDFSPNQREVAAGESPRGAAAGENSAGKAGWTPPCPPKGNSPHRYVFRLFADSKPTDLAAGAAPSDVLAAAGTHSIAQGTLTGRYGR
ncbi:MAG TPA: YbhB/YbcL family Raf kinase inhibitor-like protein [Thermoleophilaceae bacterium]